MVKRLLLILFFMSSITVYLQTQPVITTQPEDRSISEGETALFKCEFSVPYTSLKGYQWWKNPGAIKLVDNENFYGSTSYRLNVRNVSIDDDSTTYICECKDLSSYPNDSSWINSRPALLRVKQGIPIIREYHTLDVAVTEGNTAKFYCEFEGAANKGYQWWKNPGSIKLVDSENIVGSTSNTLTLQNVQLDDDGSSYTCECKNLNFYPSDSSWVNSNSAILSVNPKVWFQQNSNTQAKLNKIKFTDSLNGFAWGNHAIVTTYNGGISWEENVYPDSLSFYQVVFVNENTGWGVTDEETSFIYKTENGGISWQLLQNHPAAPMFKISFADVNNGWIIGAKDNFESHFIMHTSDGGITWEELPQIEYDNEALIAHFFELRKISFISDLVGFIYYEYGYVRGELQKTDDGGLTWNSINMRGGFFVDHCFINESNGWAILLNADARDLGSRKNYYIRKFSDGIQRPDHYYRLLKGIFGIDSLTAWVVGENWLFYPFDEFGFNTYGHFIYSTNNGGVDWTTQYFDMSLPSPRISTIYSFDNKTIWAVGENGMILKYIYTPDSATSIKNDNLVSLKYRLHQNYPNPFNPTTVIKYTIPTVDAKHASIRIVKLMVYDVLGREVKILVNENKKSGTYNVKFDASTLNSGVYFYKLQAGDFVETKKMLLIK